MRLPPSTHDHGWSIKTGTHQEYRIDNNLTNKVQANVLNENCHSSHICGQPLVKFWNDRTKISIWRTRTQYMQYIFRSLTSTQHRSQAGTCLTTNASQTCLHCRRRSHSRAPKMLVPLLAKSEPSPVEELIGQHGVMMNYQTPTMNYHRGNPSTLPLVI